MIAVPRNVVVLAAAAVTTLAACGTARPAIRPGASASPTVPAWATTPAHAPGGQRGTDWHRLNAGQPWEGRVLTVDAVGTLLFVRTDLPAADTDTALLVCRAGHAYLDSVGAPTATVTVYGAGQARLAESRDGGACRVTL